MEERDKTIQKMIEFKRCGGVQLDVFVSDSIWTGGAREEVSHEPFVAIAPSNWDSEEEVTFLRNLSEVDTLVRKLTEAAGEAFGDESTPPNRPAE